MLLGVRDRVPSRGVAIERALAKLPADRFATAREFAEALTGPPVGGYTHGSTSGYASGGVAAPEQDVRVTFAMSKARIRSLSLWTVGAAVVVIGAWGWVRPKVVPPALHVRFTLDNSDSVRPREDVGGRISRCRPTARCSCTQAAWETGNS